MVEKKVLSWLSEIVKIKLTVVLSSSSFPPIEPSRFNLSTCLSLSLSVSKRDELYVQSLDEYEMVELLGEIGRNRWGRYFFFFCLCSSRASRFFSLSKGWRGTRRGTRSLIKIYWSFWLIREFLWKANFEMVFVEHQLDDDSNILWLGMWREEENLLESYYVVSIF